MNILPLNKDLPKSENKFIHQVKSLFSFKKAFLPKFFIAILVFAGILVYATSKMGIVGAAGLGALVVGLPLVFGSMFNLRFGIIVLLIISFFILGILRFINLPLGILMDTLIGSMFFGVILKQIQLKDWSDAANPITYSILLWLAFCIFQVINPWAASKLAWLYTIRSMALLMLIYFVALYAFDSLDYFKLFLKIWIFLSFIAAIYGLYQEFVGLHPAELRWINADPQRHKLFFNWGRYRKFSYFSNPTIFGVLMTHSALLCFVLATGVKDTWKKIALGFMGFLMVWSMIYSGTRTSIAMIPAGFFFFVVLTFKRKIIFISTLFFLFGAFLVYAPIESFGPINKNNLERIRSTFEFEDDPSFQARLKNQAYIQPFIHAHPIGGGLGSVGVWGRRFSPHSPISRFPPDSGFVRIAVELGWVGLFFYSLLIFSIMYVGIKNYFSCQSPHIKLYYAALLTIVYSLIVANYAQQAITMFPTMTIFYVVMALMVVLKKFDHPTNTQ